MVTGSIEEHLSNSNSKSAVVEIGETFCMNFTELSQCRSLVVCYYDQMCVVLQYDGVFAKCRLFLRSFVMCSLKCLTHRMYLGSTK